MSSFDKESTVFEWMKSVETKDICLLTQSEQEKFVCDSILESKDWVDNSEDTNNPPDYYNDIDNLMMDFMQVNDYEIARSKKVTNPVKRRENEMEKEIRESGIMDMFPNITLFCNPDVDFSATYQTYFDNFKRVFDKHCNQINVYKTNHPNHKLIFTLVDLSEHIKTLKRSDGEEFPYFACIDKKFLSVMKNADIDFVIWYMPYVMPNENKPKITIVDVHNLNVDKYIEVLEET